MGSQAAPTRPDAAGQQQAQSVTALDNPWVTIVWDDPVNLMNYVTYVFQKLFGYTEPHATKLMLQVHQEGKAVVSAGGPGATGVKRTKPPAPRVVGAKAPDALARP